jgi:hypothetical protein
MYKDEQTDFRKQIDRLSYYYMQEINLLVVTCSGTSPALKSEIKTTFTRAFANWHNNQNYLPQTGHKRISLPTIIASMYFRFVAKTSRNVYTTKNKSGAEFKLTVKASVDTLSKVKFPNLRALRNNRSCHVKIAIVMS